MCPMKLELCFRDLSYFATNFTFPRSPPHCQNGKMYDQKQNVYKIWIFIFIRNFCTFLVLLFLLCPYEIDGKQNGYQCYNYYYFINFNCFTDSKVPAHTLFIYFLFHWRKRQSYVNVTLLVAILKTMVILNKINGDCWCNKSR